MTRYRSQQEWIHQPSMIRYLIILVLSFPCFPGGMAGWVKLTDQGLEFLQQHLPQHLYLAIDGWLLRSLGESGKGGGFSKLSTRVFNFQHLRQSKLMNLKSCMQNRHRWTSFLGTWLGSPDFDSDWLAWDRHQAIAFIARVKSREHGVKSKNFLGSWNKFITFWAWCILWVRQAILLCPLGMWDVGGDLARNVFRLKHWDQEIRTDLNYSAVQKSILSWIFQEKWVFEEDPFLFF